MSTYRKNQIVTLADSAYMAAQDPTGQPGVDPAWVLLARGLPKPVTAGNVLTIVNGKWVEAAPTGGSGGGSGSPLYKITVDTSGTAYWARSPDYAAGALSSDGTVFTLTSNAAGQFVRYYLATEKMPRPLGIAPVELQFDLYIPSADSAGMSVGMALTTNGDRGHFNFRIDVGSDGTLGCRFEQDGIANIASFNQAGPFDFDSWHTVRFVRHGGSAVAFIDGELVAGVDSSVTELADAVTLLMYGGDDGQSKARFRNIIATSYLGGGGSSSSGGSGTAAPPASTTTAGVIRIATADEATAGTSVGTAVTPAALKARLQAFTPAAATSDTAGIVRLATAQEVADGTSTTTAVTPAELATAAGSSSRSSLVIGPTNTLNVPGIWIKTDGAGGLLTVYYDDHNGTGGSNSDGQVKAGQTNPLTGPGLWLQQDANGNFTGLVYDDGNH